MSGFQPRCVNDAPTSLPQANDGFLGVGWKRIDRVDAALDVIELLSRIVTFVYLDPDTGGALARHGDNAIDAFEILYSFLDSHGNAEFHILWPGCRPALSSP